MVGPYRINSVEAHLIAMLSNKCQQGTYRGFGWEVANFVIERMEIPLTPNRIRQIIRQAQEPG